jgi:zinc transport system permease protein
MLEALQYEFMRNALAAGLLASVICGVIGSLVVVNRIVFLSGGIAHAAYGGIGLAFFFGWPYLAGTLGFSLAAAMLMALVTLHARHRADTIIGVLWAVGMAIGVILLDLTPGYNVDLMGYLFGSILTVPRQALWEMALVAAVNLTIVLGRYPEFLAMSYDEEFARIRGVPVRPLYLLMIALIAVSVVVVIRVVGLILVIALLTIPPYIAEKYARSLLQMIGLAGLLSGGFTLVGLYLSYRFDLTSGATIILVAAAGFFTCLAWERLQTRRERPPAAESGEPPQR